MEERALDYLEKGKLLQRKWQTLEIIEGSLLGVLRWESPLLAVNSRIPRNPEKSYNISHKVENQLMYVRVRKINKTLYMCGKQRSECYTKLKNIIKDQDQDIAECTLLISKIKEHRHSKTEARQIDKCSRFFQKQGGQHHNFGFFNGHISFDGHPQNNNSTSVQTHYCTRNTSIRVSTIVPAHTGPIAPTAITTSTIALVSPHTAPTNSNKWVINLQALWQEGLTLQLYPSTSQGSLHNKH